MTYKPGDVVENTHLKVMEDETTKRIVGFIHGCTTAELDAEVVRRLVWDHYDVVIFIDDIKDEQEALRCGAADGNLPMDHIAGFIEAWALRFVRNDSIQRVVKLLYGQHVPLPVIQQMRQDFLDKPKPLHGRRRFYYGGFVCFSYPTPEGHWFVNMDGTSAADGPWFNSREEAEDFLKKSIVSLT